MSSGERTCSHCHKTFKPRFLGINLLVKRYEVCPLCHRVTEVHYSLKASENRLKEEHRELLSEEEALRKRMEESKFEGDR